VCQKACMVTLRFARSDDQEWYWKLRWTSTRIWNALGELFVFFLVFSLYLFARSTSVLLHREWHIPFDCTYLVPFPGRNRCQWKSASNCGHSFVQDTTKHHAFARELFSVTYLQLDTQQRPRELSQARPKGARGVSSRSALQTFHTIWPGKRNVRSFSHGPSSSTARTA
jgi:hypothetical protein